MNFFTDNMLIIFVLPLIAGGAGLFSHIFKYVITNRTINIFTFFSNFVGLLFSIFLFKYIVENNVQDVCVSINWFHIENLSFELGIYADKISTAFLFVLMASSLAVHYYLAKCRTADKDYRINTALVNFINFTLAGVILSSNMLQTFIFSEITGVLGYLLININFQNRKISDSAKNFFILNKIGDVFMLVGIIIFIYFLITYPIYSGNTILEYSDFNETASDFYVYLSDMWFYIACMMLFGGVISKSAQFPLHVMVTDVSKTQVGVCALLSATVTVQGIFFAVRLLPLFELSETVMNTIIYIGLFTALLCSFFAVAQNNIKKMLAYSSSSQLGLMVAAIGLNIPVVAIIYFLSHAFSKTALFLVSGCLNKVSEKQNFNISDFNVSRNDYPILSYCYLIGIVSLSGLFFGGAAANDGMIKACSASMSIPAVVMFLLTCLFTAYCLFRSYFVIFENNKNTTANLYGIQLNIPIIFLTLSVIAVAFLPVNIFEFFDKYSEVQKELLGGNLKYILTYGVLIFGSVLGGYIGYTKKKPLPKYIINLSLHGLYIKKLYAVVCDFLLDVFRSFAKNFDKYIISRFFNLFSELTKWVCWLVSILQSGSIQTYITAAILIISLSIGGIGLILVLLRGIIR